MRASFSPGRQPTLADRHPPASFPADLLPLHRRHLDQQRRLHHHHHHHLSTTTTRGVTSDHPLKTPTTAASGSKPTTLLGLHHPCLFYLPTHHLSHPPTHFVSFVVLLQAAQQEAQAALQALLAASLAIALSNPFPNVNSSINVRERGSLGVARMQRQVYRHLVEAVAPTRAKQATLRRPSRKRVGASRVVVEGRRSRSSSSSSSDAMDLRRHL